MSGFYNDEGEDQSFHKTIVYAVCAASIVLLVFLLILYQNFKPAAKSDSEAVPQSEEASDDFTLSDSKLTSHDLDFWDMQKEDEEPAVEDKTDGVPAVFSDDKTQSDQVIPSDEEIEPEYNENEISAEVDGKVMKYELLDIAKSSYKKEHLMLSENGNYLYDDGSFKSKCGISVSSDMGNINWDDVKASAIDYAYIRAVRRDPVTGIISTDSNFGTNASAALSRGINIGAYVQTAAVNDGEIKEESNYAIASAQNSGAKYPVVLDFTGPYPDGCRISTMSNNDRTKIALAFCENVKSFGLTPAILGTRDFFITSIDMNELAPYELWIQDIGTNNGDNLYFTDFPYKYSMWKYSNTGEVKGIDGSVPLSLSFVDFTTSNP